MIRTSYLALIAVESNFDANAVSPKNAQGLMQLIPATAQRFGVKNAKNPLENLKGGLAYLRWLMAYFKGEVRLVLAAYNAGEETVERYRGIPPYAETRNYVKQITSVYKKASHPYVAEVAAPSVRACSHQACGLSLLFRLATSRRRAPLFRRDARCFHHSRPFHNFCIQELR